jgi:hypothetical protein
MHFLKEYVNISRFFPGVDISASCPEIKIPGLPIGARKGPGIVLLFRACQDTTVHRHQSRTASRPINGSDTHMNSKKPEGFFSSSRSDNQSDRSSDPAGSGTCDGSDEEAGSALSKRGPGRHSPFVHHREKGVREPGAGLADREKKFSRFFPEILQKRLDFFLNLLQM